MVQLSPDNPSKGWDWTSGYHYSDNTLLGFSHTHLSGTGVGDLLDVLVMPFRGDFVKRERDDKGRIFTQYQHADESATPGYYRIDLPQEQVKAELTATARTGVHRYTFTGEQDGQLLIDLAYAQNYDKPVVSYLKVENDHTLSGYRISTGWAKLQPVYFVAEFDQPFSHQLYQDGKAVEGPLLQAEKAQIVLNFGQQSAALVAKVGLSYVSLEGAKKNLAAEASDKSFTQIRQQAAQLWQQELGALQTPSNNLDDKKQFYTALYHSYLAPQTFNDVDGRFLGADGSAHAQSDYQRYSLFSLWDTFRALHPLLTISQPQRVDDMVKSMLGFYDEAGMLPTWDLMSNETDVMIAYHAVPVLVDAYLKGLTTADPHKILKAAKTSAMQSRFGIDKFHEYGYVPSDLSIEAVSKTLEYGYDDWAISQLAANLGEQADADYFAKRAQAYKTLFDKDSGLMRGKNADGTWVSPFNPIYVEHRNTDYTEANAWQYSFFVPHDVKGLASLFGTEQAFVAQLDTLFNMSSHMEGDVSPDISGLIGQYAHGNEPCHHVPYLYGFTSQKWKTEQRIRQIRSQMYRNDPDGLTGNDDLGQMSAWYIFSALGFYPVNPVGGEYILGLPLFEQLTLNLPNGNALTVVKKGDTGSNYVKEVRLNGVLLDDNRINHQQILQGGSLEFTF
uniref:GH92 family glycosyl hydrolase n=1 Tax=Paraglaciecola sp. TaxID=1920173 RepID=UPI0030F45D28